jgi:hypothetical protein
MLARARRRYSAPEKNSSVAIIKAKNFLDWSLPCDGDGVLDKNYVDIRGERAW